MSKTWTFIGGVVAGIVGVFTAAYVATELESQAGSDCPETTEQESLELPEGKGEKI